MKQALGMIEVRGLATAVKIADVLAKVAAVELVGIEPAKGAGWLTIKVVGDVGAVQAAIEAGTASAKNYGQLIAVKVIPRPVEAVATFFLKQEGQEMDEKAKIKKNQEDQTDNSSITESKLVATDKDIIKSVVTNSSQGVTEALKLEVTPSKIKAESSKKAKKNKSKQITKVSEVKTDE